MSETQRSESFVKAQLIINYAFGGEHHLVKTIRDAGAYATAAVTRGISTFDFDNLTRLVVAAHVYCCRVQINPLSGNCLELMFHTRRPFGKRLDERHRSAEELRTMCAELMESVFFESDK